MLKAMKGFIIDIDGTLFRGEVPLLDLKEFFQKLESKKLQYVIATNNTKSSSIYREKFARQGVDIGVQHILTCSGATADYIADNFSSGKNVFVIGKKSLKDDIAGKGFQILNGLETKADIVVVGGDFELNYEKLKNAIIHIQEGARLIGTNPDMLIPTEEGLWPEAGTTLAAIEAATNIKPIIIGKPEHILFDMAVAKMGLEKHEVAMIGDRLETDIFGAKQAGLRSVLVETGVDSSKTVNQKGIHPDLIVKELKDILEMI